MYCLPGFTRWRQWFLFDRRASVKQLTSCCEC